MTAQTDLRVSDRVQGSGYINVRCPADGRVVGNVPDMTPGQVHEVARQLRAAQPAWEDLGPDGRAKHVLRLLDWVARRLEAGAVNINSVLTATMLLTLPMGGWKSSGIGGRNGGAAGLLKFSRQQAIVTQRFKLRSEPHWYPYVPWMSRLQARLVRLTGAHDWRRRLGR
jgi:acyl-CoA reductase-like NAD-dependent aldehyde dehydrogenase